MKILEPLSRGDGAVIWPSMEAAKQDGIGLLVD